MKDKFVINIGRQLGSGGKAVGEAVAARLGIGVYDKQLINLAAEQSGICPEIFEKADEKESRNLFATFIGYLRSPFVGSEYSGSNVLSSDALFKIQSDVIRDLASRESCVFVGRCADYILRDHPLVKADGGVEVIDARIDRLGEAALPELFCHRYCPSISKC